MSCREAQTEDIKIRIIRTDLVKYIRQLSLPSCNNECMHSFNHISCLYMLILWISASTEWVAFLISSPLLYYGCWRHLSQRNPSHMPRPAVRPKTVTNGALNKSIRAKSYPAWTTVMARAQTWRQLAQSSKGKRMRQLAFVPERYSLNKSAITSRALTDAALGAIQLPGKKKTDWEVRPRFISSPRGSQYSHLFFTFAHFIQKNVAEVLCYPTLNGINEALLVLVWKMSLFCGRI